MLYKIINFLDMTLGEKSEKIVVVGFGWVGQANALALVRMSYEVFYYDVANPKRHYADKYQALYEKIRPLENPLQEDGINTWYIVCIGDRVSEDGHQDISLIEKALEFLRPAKGKVVLRSTVLPEYLKSLLFHIYLPEFLHEVNAVEECLNPFLFVLGANEKIILPGFIGQWEKKACKIFKGTPEEVSHIKYLSNIWNSMRIAFVNEFSDSLALPKDRKQKEEIERVIDFFFENKSYLRYGRAFGGHCLPKDTRAFMSSKEKVRPVPLLRAICESNDLHRQITKAYDLPQWFSSWDYTAYRRGAATLARRWWQKLNSWAIIRGARHLFKPIVRFFESLAPDKSLGELKAKWEKLANKNAYYYVNPDTKTLQNVDEFELRQTGEADYLKYVVGDTLLREVLGNFQDKAVLEIGAGIGRMTEFFSQNFKSVHGTDIASSMLAIARKRLIALDNVHLVESDGNRVPFSDGKFDLIFSYLVFRHLPSRALIQGYFKEIARTLKPGGVAKVQLRTGTTPHFWQWFYGVALTADEAGSLAGQAGLQVIKSETENSKSLWLWLKR